MEVHSKRAPLLNKLHDKMARKINETTLDATTRYELQARLAGMKKHTKVCHGDFNPSNIIITADGTPYILDWSHATQGNASADVARTYLLFCLEGKEALAEKYLKLFCLKSDTARQYVQKWMPIVAASQSVKGKPEEREFLLRWVDVVEYI
jgi:thiamine kinase-like enzyme